MKFGGSCLQNAESFNKIYEITKIYENEKKFYIASALNGITDLLLSTAKNIANQKEIDKNSNPKDSDTKHPCQPAGRQESEVLIMSKEGHHHWG